MSLIAAAVQLADRLPAEDFNAEASESGLCTAAGLGPSPCQIQKQEVPQLLQTYHSYTA